MSIKVPNGGETLLLEYLRGYLNTLKIKLFKNDYTPVDASVAADFTEADFTGYASQNLTTFGAAAQNGAAEAETDHDLVTFTQSGTGTTNTVYGYYVTTAGGLLVYAERNPNGGQAMDATGKTYPIIPRFVLKTRD